MTQVSHKNFPVSWEELHRNAKALAWQLHDLGPWKGLIAVARGGLVPGGIIARELDIHCVETVSIVGYHSDDSHPMRKDKISVLRKPSNVENEGKGWLVIDDLVDTGRTIELLRKMFPRAHFAAIYAKPTGKALLDNHITEISQDTWVYFPWDFEPQFMQPIAHKRREESRK